MVLKCDWTDESARHVVRCSPDMYFGDLIRYVSSEVELPAPHLG
jgi:hypothetical protein